MLLIEAKDKLGLSCSTSRWEKDVEINHFIRNLRAVN